jgi:N-acetylglucosaminyl-diphospho-decaprenol L-rhamnosyltransferase
MQLSISIVSWNTCGLLDKCLESVYRSTRGVDFEVIVVDNSSSDGSVDMVRKKYPDVHVITNTDNVGFAVANNQAIKESNGDYFLLLNPDTVCHDGAIAGLVRFLDENAKAGAVGPLVLNQDETLQYSWAKFPTVWIEVSGQQDRRITGMQSVPLTPAEVRDLGPFGVDWVCGCCMMVRRSAIDQIGCMDESLFMYCEEMDWCLRLQKTGWQVYVDPGCEIVHIGGQSSSQTSRACYAHLMRSKIAFARKHNGWCSGILLSIGLGMRSLAKMVKNNYKKN